MKTFIGFALHAYQPPTQNSQVLKKIFDESYEPVISFLEKESNAFISLDIAKSLGERLPAEFLARIKDLYLNKRLELINTAAYHYLLPLVPQRAVARQLDLNENFYRTGLTGEDPLPGVWPPELAVDESIFRLLKKLGFSWAVADDFLFEYSRRYLPEPRRAPNNWIPVLDGFGILLRSRLWSEMIAGEKFARGDKYLKNLLEGQVAWRKALDITGDSYIILAVDFETFGHHHIWAIEKFLRPFFREAEIQMDQCSIVPLDHIFKRFPKMSFDNQIAPASWSTSEYDMKKNTSFSLWNHPDNEFHKAWNQFIQIAYEPASENTNPELDSLIEKAFYSCTPWQHANGNMEIARWALPMFQKIIALSPESKKSKLIELYNIMDVASRVK